MERSSYGFLLLLTCFYRVLSTLQVTVRSIRGGSTAQGPAPFSSLTLYTRLYMRRLLPLSLLPALLPALLLAGCARTVDQFKPQIVITTPQGGAVSVKKNVVLKGYVLDDRGVASFKVQGRAVPVKGKTRISYFTYQTNISDKETIITLEAADNAGNVSKLRVPIVVDSQPPKITVTKLEKEKKTIRVSGVVTDNTSVIHVSVDGNVLNIAPGPSTDFYAETTGNYADIIAKDGAGNTATLRAR